MSYSTEYKNHWIELKVVSDEPINFFDRAAGTAVMDDLKRCQRQSDLVSFRAVEDDPVGAPGVVRFRATCANGALIRFTVTFTQAGTAEISNHVRINGGTCPFANVVALLQNQLSLLVKFKVYRPSLVDVVYL